VDVYLAVASRRDHKGGYSDRAIPEDVVARVLDAGRLAGSAVNRQPWRFLVVESEDARRRLSETVYSPSYVLEAPLVVLLVATGGRKGGLDHGRAAQNMFLTAWSEGLASGPTGFSVPEPVKAAVHLGDDEQPVLVLAFGYARRPRDPDRRPAEEWSRRASRRPLDELVTRI
jgi:nitroreductase